MGLYRRKPVVIEARQITPGSIFGVAHWCSGKHVGLSLPRADQGVLIETLEGEMRATMGDWVIQGVQGEFYPCKPDIFAATYEPVA